MRKDLFAKTDISPEFEELLESLHREMSDLIQAAIVTGVLKRDMNITDAWGVVVACLGTTCFHITEELTNRIAAKCPCGKPSCTADNDAVQIRSELVLCMGSFLSKTIHHLEPDHKNFLIAEIMREGKEPN